MFLKYNRTGRHQKETLTVEPDYDSVMRTYHSKRMVKCKTRLEEILDHTKSRLSLAHPALTKTDLHLLQGSVNGLLPRAGYNEQIDLTGYDLDTQRRDATSYIVDKLNLLIGSDPTPIRGGH